MSLYNLLQPNDLSIYAENLISENVIAEKINGITGTIISPTNTIGQVLTIKSVSPKEVEFQDASGGSITIPVILTGENTQALQVNNLVDDKRSVLNTDASVQGLLGVGLPTTTPILQQVVADSIGLNESVGYLAKTNKSELSLSANDVGGNATNTILSNADLFINNNQGTISLNNEDVSNGTTILSQITSGLTNPKIELNALNQNMLIRGGDNGLIIDSNNVNITSNNVILEGQRGDNKFAVVSERDLMLNPIAFSKINDDSTNTPFTVNQATIPVTSAVTHTIEKQVGALGDACGLIVDAESSRVQLASTNTDSFVIFDAPLAGIDNTRVGSNLQITSAGPITINSNTTSSITSSNGANTLIASNGAQFTQFSVQNTGSLLLIEDILVPTQNHLQLSYNSIVSKGNPLSQTSTIDMYPATDDVSFHRRNQDQISVYANPVSDAINFPLTLSLATDTTNWTELPFTAFSWTSSFGPNFVIEPITNRVQYTGVNTRTFLVVFEICADTVANDQMVQLCMYKTNTTGTIPTNELEAESFGCFLTKDTPKTGGTCLSFKHTVNQNEYLNWALRTPRAVTSIDVLHGIKIQAIEL